jgi:hypothetical protein
LIEIWQNLSVLKPHQIRLNEADFVQHLTRLESVCNRTVSYKVTT